MVWMIEEAGKEDINNDSEVTVIWVLHEMQEHD
jgi:hypothetical protein